MNVETDQEIVQLVGSEEMYVSGMASSLEECASKKIYTAAQALEYIGSKIKIMGRQTFRRPKVSTSQRMTLIPVA